VESFMPPANLPHAKSTEYPLNVRLDRTHSQSRCSGEKKVSCPCQELSVSWALQAAA